MKLIHCADIHLDASMAARLTQEQAKMRKTELLQTFLHMIDYAQQEHVTAILIAGDLFDTEVVSAVTRKKVYQAIEAHPEISFFYLKGNHDKLQMDQRQEEQPENLYMFSEQWQSYSLYEPGCETPVVINGVELTEANSDKIYDSLQLEKEPFQIVMLHGQVVTHDGEKQSGQISLSALAGKQIDYLALGHIHKRQSGTLDGRGSYCYSGCLEGRGFDECGPHGFVLLDIDCETHHCKMEFQPFAKRQYHWVTVDVTGCIDPISMEKKIQDVLQNENAAPADLVRVEITGKIPVDAEKNATYLQQMFAERYFYLELKDHTTLEMDADAFALDASLKGEFVRLVSSAEELDEQTKAKVIRVGLQLLTGTELES
ncbi:MAG: exonuclease SbcCD subunit D [Lachnospiraceae bacterium]